MIRANATPKQLADYVESNPNKLGGEPVFVRSRVPVRILFDHLRDGLTIEQFLEGFEGVTREQAEAVLELGETELLRQVTSR